MQLRDCEQRVVSVKLQLIVADNIKIFLLILKTVRYAEVTLLYMSLSHSQKS